MLTATGVALGLGLLAPIQGNAQAINPDTALDPPRHRDQPQAPAVNSGKQTVMPRARPAPGTYVGRVDIQPYHPDPNARIFYTTDGSVPTMESREHLPRLRGTLNFFTPIPLTSSQTFKMIAVSNGQSPSGVVSFDYTVTVAPPDSVYGSGTYREMPTRLPLRSATDGATIHYTLDGSIPDRDSPVYKEPIELGGLEGPVTVAAIAVKTGAPDSPVTRLSYQVDPGMTVLTDEASIPAVIEQMTDREKALLLTGTRSQLGAAGATNVIPRFHITSLELADGPAGVRLGGRLATAFPNPMMLAATWNPELLEEVGRAVGTETAYYGADIILGPGMNLHRDPLGGRVFEYYSEDPYLTGVLAGAWSSGAQNAGIGACLKHYAVNQYENNRRAMNVVVSERALREIYLKSFEIAVGASDPRAIMAAYNLVNSIHASESAYLLKDMLRGEFGFTGFAMPDWGAYHHAQSSYSNGLDLNTPGGNLFGGLLGGPDITIDEITYRDISKTDIDAALTNILRAVVKSESFANQVYDRSEFRSLVNLSDELKLAGNELSQRAAREGIVLLKNADGTLPLAEGATGAVAGSHAKDEFIEPSNIWGSPSKGLFFQGGGSARVNVDPNDVVSLVQGLRNSGFGVYQTDALVEGMGMEAANDAAANADVGIVLIARPGQENTDNTSIDLTADEIRMIDSMSAAFHSAGKKIVALLNVAHPVTTAAWEDKVDAILYIGMPGNYGSNVVADILVGNVNPSGKTTDTWPARHEDVPVFGKAPLQSDVEIHYDDDIYVGYRHYDRKPEGAHYPFGYGLSYTTFSYDNVELSVDSLSFSDGPVTVTVDVTNSGDVAGQEIAQLYISKQDPGIDRPVKELRGFAKTRLLEPGETEKLSFEIEWQDLAYFDEQSHEWAVERGRYDIIVGGTSDAAELGRSGVSAGLVATH